MRADWTVLESGDFEDLPVPIREHMLAIAQQASEVVIAVEECQRTGITHWWLIRTSPDTKLAYFGNPGSYATWKKSEVQ